MLNGKPVYLLLMAFWLGAGIGQSGGVHFFTGTWSEMKAESRRQHKPIFLVVSASWCPSCRRMTREGLVSPVAGAAYNDRFINYQLDANLGDGPAVARRYGVVSYPTALFLAPDGQLVHRAVGYGGVNGLVQQADFVRRLPALRRALRNRPRVTSEPDTVNSGG